MQPQLTIMGNAQVRQRDIRNVQVEIPDFVDQPTQVLCPVLDRMNDLARSLLPEAIPIHSHKRVFSAHIPDDLVVDPGTAAQTSEVNLLNAALAPDIVHEVKGISTFAYKCHDCVPSPA
ncbi:MAG: hypothetical protein ACRD11_08105 [Terriglobia bacterium]